MVKKVIIEKYRNVLQILERESFPNLVYTKCMFLKGLINSFLFKKLFLLILYKTKKELVKLTLKSSIDYFN